MPLRPLVALLPAVLAIVGRADDSGAAAPSAPIPAESIWDANAWEPESAGSFWRKPAASTVRPSPKQTNRGERRAAATRGSRETTPPRPFSSRQTGK
jgi:hypothetical protein